MDKVESSAGGWLRVLPLETADWATAKPNAWFSVAAAQSAVTVRAYYGPEDILRKRDFKAACMSNDEILRARRPTVQCYKSEYKNCD
jgi:hypothetical protein